MSKTSSTTSPPRHGAPWYAKALLGLAVTVLFLGILEGGFRALISLPGADVLIPPKPPGTLRIVVAGGSTAEGFPVPCYGFPAQLEAAARILVPDQPVEVLNLGASGRASPYVRRVVEQCLERGSPDAVVVLCGHNEYLDRSGEALALPALKDALGRTGLARAGHEVSHAIKRRTRTNQSLPQGVKPYDRASPWFAYVLDRYQKNLDAMAAAAAARKVPFILCTAPSNLAEWPPVWRGLSADPSRPERDAELSALSDRVAEGAWADATRLADSLAERDPDNAYVAYVTSRCRQADGDPGGAASGLVRARDLDPIPWRAGTAINEAVRTVANEHAEVVLADVDAALVGHAPDGLPGFESFDDNCHPTPLGNAVIVRVLLDRLVQAGVLEPRGSIPDDPAAWLETYRATLGTPAYVAALDARRRLRSGMYCMKHPFLAFGASERHLQAALEASPGMWEAWGNLGALRLLEQRWDEGHLLLDHAETLRGLPLDPDDISTVPYLAEALRHAQGDLAP